MIRFMANRHGARTFTEAEMAEAGDPPDGPIPTDMKPQMIVDHTVEEPLMCAVCGCVWLEEQAPEEKCPEATCPCHHKYWNQTDELIRRWLDGDR